MSAKPSDCGGGPVRIGVVGVGHMGSLHAEKVAALAQLDPRLALAGVADIDETRARRVAGRAGTRAYALARELVPTADAAIVAVPTVEHFSVVRTLLEAGLDVLVEKPIAASREEAEQMLAIARRRQLVLQVGHQEWFNPAMQVIRERIRVPRFVEVHRMGASERSTDVDVVRDLMIHDLEILQQLLGEEPERIEAIGVPVISDQIDIANARIAFAAGCVANLTASRVSVTPMRKLRFFQRDGYFTIDFLAQSAAIFRRLGSENGGQPRIEMEELKIDAEDALLGQLRAFVGAVSTRNVTAVSGDDALAALRTALRVIDAMPPIETLA